MKTSKKVLGAVLALVMVLNVFAMGAFAALGTDAVISLDIKTDKASYAPGDEVIVTFGTTAVEAVGKISIGSQIAVSYNKAAIVPYSDSTDITAHGFTPAAAYSAATAYDTGLSQVIFNDVLVGNGQAAITADDTANGWDSVVAYCVSDGSAAVYQDATAGIELFSIKMKIPETAANGTYKLGFNKTAITDGYFTYVNSDTYATVIGNDPSWYGFSTTENYELGTVEIKVGPSVEVTHVKQQSKWNGGNDKNTAENYLFGFVGQVSGLELTTEKVGERDMVKEIKSITATATYNGGTATSEVITVWEVEGGYQFRAQFAGFQPTDAKEVSVVFAITMIDGTTVYESASETKAINAIYAASVTNGLPALAA